MYNIQQKFHLRPYVKNGFHCINYDEILSYSTAVRVNLPYKVPSKSVKKVEKIH